MFYLKLRDDKTKPKNVSRTPCEARSSGECADDVTAWFTVTTIIINVITIQVVIIIIIFGNNGNVVTMIHTSTGLFTGCYHVKFEVL